jgi:hypothetical protein
MKKAIFALASNEANAQKIVDRLLASRFAKQDISLLCSDRNKQHKHNPNAECCEGECGTKKKSGLKIEKHTKAPEGGAAGATAGGLLGGSLGLLAGIGALAIPGLGPVIAAGPLMAALSGSAIGGSLGLLIGALVGSGIPEYEARKYEASLKAGNILICIHTDNPEEINRAKEILKNEGAKDISTSAEKARSSH